MIRPFASVLLCAAVAATLVGGCAAGHSSGFTPSFSSQGDSSAASRSVAAPDAAAASVPDAGPAVPDSVDASGKAIIAFSPSSASLLGAGAESKLEVKVADSEDSGALSIKSSCSKVATIDPASLKKPGDIVIEGKAAGTCSLVFEDSKKHTATLKVADTTASIDLVAASISPHSKSAILELIKADGKTPSKSLVSREIVNLEKCSDGCTLVGPQAPAGDDEFAVKLTDETDGKGKTLALGDVTGKIVAEKNVKIDATLPKVVASLEFGTLPSATAGTAFSAPQPIPLAAKDPDGDTISGDYASTIVVTDPDKSGATSISNGTIKSSTEHAELNYTGAAIDPVTLSAAASGLATATAAFAPALPPITTNAPLSTGAAGQAPAGSPEIDLSSSFTSHSFTVAQDVYTGSFTAVLGPASISGDSSDCALFTLAKTAGNAFTIALSSGADELTGVCEIEVAGGYGKTLDILATNSISSITIQSKRHAH